MKPEQTFEAYIQADNKNIFQIFNNKKLNIDWKNASILDYGCNQGNYINSASQFINSEKYLGVDIIQKSIDLAKEKHPGYKFVHYNKWHQIFNPTGNKNIKISSKINEKFDVIICYSVFTHSTIEQTKDELKELITLLNPNGMILFTVWSVASFKPFYQWMLERFEKVKPIDFNKLNYEKMAYWINTSTIITDAVDFCSAESNSFNTFYDLIWLSEEINPAIYLGVPAGQSQHLYCLKK